jgi:hypothetical protein
VQPALQPGDPGYGGGGGDGLIGACIAGFNTCLRYVQRLGIDLGYVDDARELAVGCKATYQLCVSNENQVQTNPKAVAGITMFPPEKASNGGGYVIHLKGAPPVYVPPSYDPLAGIPPAK